MKGSEFIKRVRKFSKKQGMYFECVAERGKGSHCTLYLGKRHTIIRNLKDELKTGTLNAMLKQICLNKKDI